MAVGWRGPYNRYKDLFLNIVALYKQRRDLRAFLELILSLSTIIIFVVFALKPTVLTIISLNNDIKAKRQTLTDLTQKVSDLKTANSVFTKNQSVIPDIDAAIFDTPQPDTISKQILGLGVKDSVTVLGISVGQIIILGKTPIVKASTDLKPLPNGTFSMPISVSIKGTYDSVTAFVKDFESLRIPSKIDLLTINSSQTQTGNAIVGVITGRIPYIGAQ